MQNEQTELQKLFPQQAPNFNLPSDNDTQSSQGELPEDLKNRHVRRLEEKLQRERESNIELAAKYSAITEAQKLRNDVGPDELDQIVARIYGTEKPENAAATDLLQKAFKGYSERAKQEAIETVRSEFRQSQAEDQREVETVKSYIEQIEDQYGVDFTSTAAGRERQQQFRDLWFRLSPKDKDGEIAEYADPFEVYEIFQSRQPQSQAAALSQRSMVHSRQVESGVTDDATVKFLKENGIIDPF